MNLIIKVFIIEFIALAVSSLFSRNWGMFLYGVGGAILNVGVLVLNKG